MAESTDKWTGHGTWETKTLFLIPVLSGFSSFGHGGYSEQCCTLKSSGRILDLRMWSGTVICLPWIDLSLHDLTWCYRVAFSLLLFFFQHTHDTLVGELRDMHNFPCSNFNLTLFSSTQDSKERSEKDIRRKHNLLFIWMIFLFVKFSILEEASDSSHNSLGHTCVVCCSPGE